MKVAVVSAYYKESPQVLQRCIDSVAGQTHRCTHFLVSDGHPQAIVDAAAGASRKARRVACRLRRHAARHRIDARDSRGLRRDRLSRRGQFLPQGSHQGDGRRARRRGRRVRRRDFAPVPDAPRRDPPARARRVVSVAHRHQLLPDPARRVFADADLGPDAARVQHDRGPRVLARHRGARLPDRPCPARVSRVLQPVEDSLRAGGRDAARRREGHHGGDQTRPGDGGLRFPGPTRPSSTARWGSTRPRSSADVRGRQVASLARRTLPEPATVLVTCGLP